MNTQHGIRKFALVAALATGALIASATQAQADRSGDAQAASGRTAVLGHLTVLARRESVADLGSLIVSAPRVTPTSFADLGALTVTAPRFADTRVANLGSLTVTARRIDTMTVATAQTPHPL